MTVDELKGIFEAEDYDYLNFEAVENKRSPRPDVHAFLLLDELLPPDGGQGIVSAAEHDEIWLDVDIEKLVEVVTEEQLIELIRCGVRYDEGSESFAMFV